MSFRLEWVEEGLAIIPDDKFMEKYGWQLGDVLELELRDNEIRIWKDPNRDQSQNTETSVGSTP